MEPLTKLAASPAPSARMTLYGHKIGPLETTRRQLLFDQQTSGGLLVAAVPEGVEAFLPAAASQALDLQPIGDICACAGGPRISAR